MICEKFVSLQEELDPPQEMDVKYKMEKYQEIQLDQKMLYLLQKERDYPPVDGEVQQNIHEVRSILQNEDVLEVLNKTLKTIEESIKNPGHIREMVKEDVVRNMYED